MDKAVKIAYLIALAGIALMIYSIYYIAFSNGDEWINYFFSGLLIVQVAITVRCVHLRDQRDMLISWSAWTYIWKSALLWVILFCAGCILMLFPVLLLPDSSSDNSLDFFYMVISIFCFWVPSLIYFLYNKLQIKD